MTHKCDECRHEIDWGSGHSLYCPLISTGITQTKSAKRNPVSMDDLIQQNGWHYLSGHIQEDFKTGNIYIGFWGLRSDGEFIQSTLIPVDVGHKTASIVEAALWKALNSLEEFRTCGCKCRDGEKVTCDLHSKTKGKP